MSTEATGVTDMGSAVEAAFTAASSPDAASTPTVDTPAPSASETATTEVTTAAVPPQTVTKEPPGPVPYERFKERNEAANKYEQELKTLEWAKAIKAEHAEHLKGFYDRFQANPLTLLEEAEHLAAHPVYAGALKSWAARILGLRGRTSAAPVEDAEPAPDIQLEDGRMVYSADALKQHNAWSERKFQQTLTQKLQPLEQAEQTRQAQARAAEITTEARNQGISEVQSMRESSPYFKEHEQEIKAAMLADEKLSLKDAYLKVVLEKVVPKQGQQHAAQVQQKVAASSANPSRPSGAASGPPKTFREGLVAAFGAQ